MYQCGSSCSQTTFDRSSRRSEKDNKASCVRSNGLFIRPFADLAGWAFTHTTGIFVWCAFMTATAKVGLEPRGAALACATGACLAAGYSLLQDHDERRFKKSVAGGSLVFLGSYLFLRGESNALGPLNLCACHAACCTTNICSIRVRVTV